MGIISTLSLYATELLEPIRSTHFVASILEWISSWVGNYGWTVVVFTIMLSVALSPLDVWQKVVMYKNSKAMKRMKPQLEKLQKQYGNNKERFQQEQMRLYKQEKYSMLGACLPMILTIVVFFIVFAGFTATTKYNAEQNYVSAYNAYAVAADDFKATTDLDPNSTAYEEGWKAAGDAAVSSEYNTENFYWVKNVFLPDNWSSVIPSEATFRGTGIGSIGSDLGKDAEYTYTDVMSSVQTNYTGWNGLLILPILSIGLNFLSQFLSKKFNQQPQQDATQQSSMKAMQFIMPIMMGVFAILYSAAFTIYIVARALISTLMQLGFNIVASYKDKKAEEEYLRTNFK